MGKKTKLGKSRKDKFYQLAKEAGYRSRAAFKLLQLNRTYHFLEKSKVCIDLCAAPGGWLQVAVTHMPVQSLVIGVDLAPIRPIANVITHIEDITTEKCRSTLRKDLNDNKADVVLHDGAPNVGKNWIHDAYQQNMLVLQSFKLASEFLKKGGWFVTKVFRSKDYFSLMWVFQQFFKKVESTKPQASRNESAEIFIVCQNYKAPDRIDPKFFDIKFVFSDVENQNDNKKIVDLFKDNMNQRHRGGYPDNDFTLFHKLKASDFIKSENFVELLSNSNMIEIDNESIEKHPSTTVEIKECLKDIKILGKPDLKNLLKWRLKLRSDLYKDEEEEKPVENKTKIATTNENNEDDNDELQNEINEAVYNEKKLDKKKKKKLQKEKQKLKEKLKLKMEFQNDIVDHGVQGDNEIFSLNKIKTKKQLLELQGTLPGLEISDSEDEDQTKTNKKKKILFSKFDQNIDDDMDGDDDKNSDQEEDPEFENDSDLEINKYSDDEQDEEENPLLKNLSDSNSDKKTSKTNLWFNKEAFDFLKDSNEQNREILQDIDLDEESSEKKKETNKKENGVDMSKFDSGSESEDDNEDDDDDDSEDDDDFGLNNGKRKQKSASKEDSSSNKKVKLSTEELAIGEMLVNSKKAKRDLIDESYNRYSRFENDEELPKWFVEDEEKNFKKTIAVPKRVYSEYKKKDDDINARQIKKVVEAQARKKKRQWKKMERARKKAEVVSDNLDMTDKERSKEIKSIYKKAGLISKKKAEVKYVVAKRGVRGRTLAKNIKGPYKVVDKRLKKDRAGQAKLQKNRMLRKQRSSKLKKNNKK